MELVGYFDGMLKVFVVGMSSKNFWSPSYYSTGNDNAKGMLENKKDAIARFGNLILQPLIKLYNVPLTSCNIFYDLKGPLIAFNRNGSLFLNLRFYEAWHDTDVQKGDLSQAYVSW